MKTISKDGKLWFEKKATAVEVGLTASFIAELEGCWHMLPAANQKTEIKENNPLIAVETNDGLFSLPSPVSGVIAFFDNKAMNFPEKLTSDDVICRVQDKPVEEKRVFDLNVADLEAMLEQNDRWVAQHLQPLRAERAEQEAPAQANAQRGVAVGQHQRNDAFNFFDAPQVRPVVRRGR